MKWKGNGNILNFKLKPSSGKKKHLPNSSPARALGYLF